MRRYSHSFILAVALLVSAISACSCSHSPPPDPVNVAHYVSPGLEPMAKSVVSIFAIRDNEIKLVGSGVVLKCEAGQKKKVITAFHVVDAINDLGSPLLVGHRGSYRMMYPLKEDPQHDLALLETSSNEVADCPTAKLATDYPQIGSTTWIVGSPLGHEGNLTKGVLSNVLQSSRTGAPTLTYRTDAAAAPGNSGGGLFNTYGELIGIISYMELMSNPMPSLFPVPVPGSTTAIALPHIEVLVYSP